MLLASACAYLLLALAFASAYEAVFFFDSEAFKGIETEGGLSPFAQLSYFSLVTLTTLGYGDVVLSGDWRTLASIQAANGVIIFGWTTALIFYFIQRIYKKD